MMTDRRKFLGGATALGALLLTGCEKVQQTMEAAGVLLNQGKGNKRFTDFRYRLTVEVETPEGIKSGSSVIEIRSAIRGPNAIPDAGYLYTEVTGEAVTVDLGERGLLFAVLRSEGNIHWAEAAPFYTLPRLAAADLHRLTSQGIDSYEWQLAELKKRPLEQAVPLPRYVEMGVEPAPTTGAPNGYPLLVRFRNIADPASVERVDPDNLAKTFGEGFELDAVKVARTESRVSNRIQSVLPWLEPIGRKRSTLIPNPPRYYKDMKDITIETLSSAEFSTELYK